ncbi:MAG: prephenate dehydrogenase/arogenate dehydrogenase family protein [Candidatus Thorarchaeota archaeon]
MRGNNLTIIGGTGGMGQVFAKYFKQHGIEITIHDRDEKKLKNIAKNLGVNYELELEKSVENADFIMISIPIHSTPEMIEKIAPYMKKNSTIFDITSVKQETYKTLDRMCKKYPINCLSLHPMFGPGIKNFDKYTLIVLKVGGTEYYDEIVEELLDIFKSDGLLLTETTYDTHDKYIALTLGLPHMLNILFLTLLKKTSKSLTELTNYTGTSFLLQKVFAESIIQREMEMFGEIQMKNQEFYQILDTFESIIVEYKKIIKKKDIIRFNKIFNECLEYSKEDIHFNNSYYYFYEFMKILKEKEI